MKLNNLKEKALLVKVTRHMWSGNVSDDVTANEILTQKEGEAGNGKFTIFVIPKSELRPIANAGWACRAILYRYSLPWSDGGSRILPIESYLDFVGELNKSIDNFNKVVKEFLAHYPELVERTQAKVRLGTLSDRIRFPSVDELRSSFRISTEMLPIPESSDFRAEIDDSDLKKIRKNMDSSIEECAKTALRELWNNLLEKVESLYERLDKDGSVNVQLKSLKTVVDSIPVFNFIQDDQLDETRKEVEEKLTSIKEDDVNDKNKRKKVAKEAEKIINKMKGYKF